MRPSAELLNMVESCKRKGTWGRDWVKWKISDTEMIQRSIRAGLLSERPDFDVVAGEETMTLSAEPGLESKEFNLYDQCVNLAALSEILTHATRKATEKPWLVPEDVSLGNGTIWRSSALLDPSGTHLRRLALVSSWNNDRQLSETRGWQALGEVCVYSLPMQLVIAVIGSSRNGKRSSPWTRAFRHPVNKGIRFRRKGNPKEGFKSSWQEIWREDYSDISTDSWYSQMIKDGIIQDYLFKLDIQIPEREARKKIVDLAERQLENLYRMKELPPQQFSTCDWPIPCLFRNNCHSGVEPSGRYGFVRIDNIN